MNMENNKENSYFKKYIEMSNYEKKLALNFMNSNNKDINSIKKLDNMFMRKIYDEGNGVIFYFDNKNVLGKILVVLECTNPLKTSFIYGLEVVDEIKENLNEIISFINEGRNVAVKYGAEKIKFGIKDEKILKVLEKAGFYTKYDSIKMNLIDRQVRENILWLEKLTEDNRLEYLEIFNNSFRDMPHGTWLDNEGLEEFLKNKDNNKHYFIVRENNEIIGFVNFEIVNDEGTFDIGLSKKNRGKGYGKKLLETAISFLNDKNVSKIYLIVIEKNEIAYNMYKKRGFIKENTINHWIEL